MASVVFYFQVHQPYRLRRYSVFDSDPFYFDSQKNGEIARKVADKCYRPMTNMVLDLVKRHEGRFRVSYAITGVALDQFAEYTPDVIDIFKRLADTGCCEFVGETYHHSLAFLYSREEFKTQVDAHTKKIQDLFGQTPTVFRNTELIYSNDIARFVSQMTRRPGQAAVVRADLRGDRPAAWVPIAELPLPAARHRDGTGRKAVRASAEELPSERRHRVPVQQPRLGGLAVERGEVRRGG